MVHVCTKVHRLHNDVVSDFALIDWCDHEREHSEKVHQNLKDDNIWYNTYDVCQSGLSIQFFSEGQLDPLRPKLCLRDFFLNRSFRNSFWSAWLIVSVRLCRFSSASVWCHYASNTHNSQLCVTRKAGALHVPVCLWNGMVGVGGVVGGGSQLERRCRVNSDSTPGDRKSIHILKSTFFWAPPPQKLQLKTHLSGFTHTSTLECNE